MLYGRGEALHKDVSRMSSFTLSVSRVRLEQAHRRGQCCMCRVLLLREVCLCVDDAHNIDLGFDNQVQTTARDSGGLHGRRSPAAGSSPGRAAHRGRHREGGHRGFRNGRNGSLEG